MLQSALSMLPQVVQANPLWSVFILLIVLYLTSIFIGRMTSKLPPGPIGYPIVGCMFHLDNKRVPQQVSEYCRYYKSDIICLANPGKKTICLNSYELVKKVFQMTEASDRDPAMNLFRDVDPTYTGVANTSGDTWKQVRRFSISMLRDLGMGRFGAEDRIQEESELLRLKFSDYNGEAFDPEDDVNIAVSNIICQMVFGQRFNRDDADFMKALEGMRNVITAVADIRTLLALLIPAVRIFMRERFRLFCDNCEKFKGFVEKQIEDHKMAYDGEVTDLIHGFLKEMESGGDPEIFHENMLRSVIIDYFFAGSETTYSTLRWCILAMAANPDVQAKVQDELDNVMGNIVPSMSHKKSTPFTVATLCEIQRHYTIVPNGMVHFNKHSEIEVDGYVIPKGSDIIANLHAIHHDTRNWKNPSNFDPTNFLDENGQIANLEKFVPFSVGRRSCAGEALARMELYIFFASIVKNFEIKLEHDDSVADMDGIVKGTFQPKPFSVRMNPRHR